MTIYTGEAVTIIVSAVNPVDGSVISDALGTAEFYAPGKKPKSVPSDRVPDADSIGLVFNPDYQNRDGSTGAYIGQVDTAGWAPGRWTYKAILSGVYDSWEFGTFTLAV